MTLPMQPTPPSIEPEGLFDGLRWGPILLGGLLDNLLTNLAVIPLMIFFAPAEAFSSDAVAAQEAMEQATLSPGFLSVSFGVGLSITVYASYWASRRAGGSYLRHGGWVAVTSSVMAMLLTLFAGGVSGPQPPFWYSALGFAAVIPAGLLGGLLAAKRAGT